MLQEIDVKYNVFNIKLFLNIFGLEIEEREEYKKGESLLIFRDDIEAGKAVFAENCIKMEAASIYGMLKADTSYALAFVETDSQTVCQLGPYAKWNNVFQFSLQFLHKNSFSGTISLVEEKDAFYGDAVTSHAKLNYQDGEKNYQILIQTDGFPFHFIERRKYYQEEIVYNIFNTWGTGGYFHHTVQDTFCDDKMRHYDYHKCAFIGKKYDHKKKNIAVSYAEFGDKQIYQTYQEFLKASNDDEDSKEVINKINAMNFLDSSMRDKLNKIMNEFSVDGDSFLENMILYGFTNYSHEEINALFGIEKGGLNLEQAYFGYEDTKTMGSKVFVPENLGK